MQALQVEVVVLSAVLAIASYMFVSERVYVNWMCSCLVFR
jgi:hypothetical protein